MLRPFEVAFRSGALLQFVTSHPFEVALFFNAVPFKDAVTAARSFERLFKDAGSIRSFLRPLDADASRSFHTFGAAVPPFGSKEPIIVYRGTTVVNTITTTPSQPTILLVRKSCFTVTQPTLRRHQGSYDDQRLSIPPFFLGMGGGRRPHQLTTPSMTMALLCAGTVLRVIRFGIHYRHDVHARKPPSSPSLFVIIS